MSFDRYNKTINERLLNASRSRILNISGSSLHQVPNECQKLTMLRRFEANDNYITTIPSFIETFSQLKYLNISRNQLENITFNIGLLKNLEHLDISNNKLTDIPETISGCVSLKNFIATDNNLTVFPISVAKILCLECLNLSKNRIELIPDEISDSNVIKLELNDNHIYSVNLNKLFDCKRLNTLNINNNRLPFNDIEYLLTNAPKSLKVAAENNFKTSIQIDKPMGNESSKASKSFNPRKIVGSGPSTSTINKHLEMAEKSRVLQLKGSGLKKFPEQIEQLSSILRNLELSENKIVEIPIFIGKFEQLKQLHLANNCIESLPDEIGHLKKLETLNLTGNRLSSLPGTIAGCVDLKNLDVSFNNFTEFPKQTLAILQLEVLSINDNKIEEIPDEISTLSASELVLNKNRLKMLNANNLAKCSRLRTIKVEENCLEKKEFTQELLENPNIRLIAYDGNLFQDREFQDLNGYEKYQERFTATKRKI